MLVLSIPIIKNYRISQVSEYEDSRAREIILLIFLVIVIGTRPISRHYFVDMADYALDYQLYEDNQLFQFNWATENLLFDNLLVFWATKHLGITTFFVVISAIYFCCSFVGIKRLFPNHTLPAYITFLAAFSTFSYATNGIKSGAAAAIFILALSYWDKKWLCMMIVLVSLGFHHSMQLPAIALMLVFLVKRPKWFYYGWIFCLAMAVLHVSEFQVLFAGMTDEHGAGYLLNPADTDIGFRLDFILYSAVPVWIGYQFEIKRQQTSVIYSILLHFYIVANAVWMLCMYASFTNRIAYLSWFVYPIVLIYPFLYVDERENRYVYFSDAMKYHLYFTLFMVFFYYGLLKQ